MLFVKNFNKPSNKLLDSYYYVFLENKDLPYDEMDNILMIIYVTLFKSDRYNDQIRFFEGKAYNKRLVINMGVKFYRDYFLEHHRNSLNYIIYNIFESTDYYLYIGDINPVSLKSYRYNSFNTLELEFLETIRWEICYKNDRMITNFIKGYYTNPVFKNVMIKGRYMNGIRSILRNMETNIDNLTIRTAICFYTAIMESVKDDYYISDSEFAKIFNLDENISNINREEVIFESHYLLNDLFSRELITINKLCYMVAFPTSAYLLTNNKKGKTIMDIDLDTTTNTRNKEYLKLFFKHYERELR